VCHVTNYYCISIVSCQADSRYTDTVSLYTRSQETERKYENLAIRLVSFHVTVSKSHFAPMLQYVESKLSLPCEGRESTEVILNRATDSRRVHTLPPWSLYPQG